MNSWIKSICFTFLLFTAFNTHAQVIVSDAILEFKNNDRLIESIAIGNASPIQPLNVVAKVFEVKNPGATKEELMPTKDAFVVPEIFSLSPRTQRTVRFAIQQRPDEEKVYRVTLEPALIEDAQPQKSEIKLLSSTSVIIIINPPNAKDNLSWQHEGDRILFENTGNTNIILGQKDLCAEDTPCNIPGERLWAGDKWILNLPPQLQAMPLTLEYRTLGTLKEIVVPYE